MLRPLVLRGSRSTPCAGPIARADGSERFLVLHDRRAALGRQPGADRDAGQSPFGPSPAQHLSPRTPPARRTRSLLIPSSRLIGADPIGRRNLAPAPALRQGSPTASYPS